MSHDTFTVSRSVPDELQRPIQDIEDEINRLHRAVGTDIPDIESIVSRQIGRQIRSLAPIGDDAPSDLDALSDGVDFARVSRLQVKDGRILSTARTEQIAELAEDVNGEVSEVKIRNMYSDIIKGQDLTIVNHATGAEYEVTASETQPTIHAPSTLSIEGDRDTGTARVNAREGDPIIVPGGWRNAYELIQPDQIKQEVRQERDLRSVGSLSADVDGASVTSLPMNSLETALDANQTIEVIRFDYVEDADGVYVPETTVWEATVSSDTAASPNSSTSIPINSTEVRANAFSPVFVRNAELNSSIIQNVDEIILRVKSSEQMSELTVNLESITVDTHVFRSDGWNGSVDGSGNITSGSSNPGWALTGSGNLELVSNDNATIFDENGIELDLAPSDNFPNNAPEYGIFFGGTTNTDPVIYGRSQGITVTAGSGQGTLDIDDTTIEMAASNHFSTRGAAEVLMAATYNASSLPDIGNAGTGELGVDSNGFVKRA